MDGQVTWSDLGISFGRTLSEHSAATQEKTSTPCWKKLRVSQNQDFGFGPKRAAEFRAKCRETFAAYAELCIENAKGDQQMDYTKGCIDRELQRILGDAAQPWEERYPKEVFG